MISVRDSLSKKLTAMNLLVSGGALLLASLAFFAYDLFTFRTNTIANTSVQAHMIASNAVSPLIFNDVPAAQNTLSALSAARRIVYAGIYTAKGQFFVGYWRQGTAPFPPPLPPFRLDEEREALLAQPPQFFDAPNGFFSRQAGRSRVYPIGSQRDL